VFPFSDWVDLEENCDFYQGTGCSFSAVYAATFVIAALR